MHDMLLSFDVLFPLGYILFFKKINDCYQFCSWNLLAKTFLRHFNVCASSLPSQLLISRWSQVGMAAVGTNMSSVISVDTLQFICFQQLGLFFSSSSWKRGYIFLQLYFSPRHLHNHSNLSFHSTLLLLNSELSRSTCVCQVMWLPHRELQLLSRLLVMSLPQAWLVWLHVLLLCSSWRHVLMS